MDSIRRAGHEFGQPGFRHVMLCDPEKGIDDYGQVNCGACEQGVDVTLAVRTPKGVWLCGHCDAEVKKLEEGKI